MQNTLCPRRLTVAEAHNLLIRQLTSILPHIVASSRNETTAAGSDGFCVFVVVLNRGVEFIQ